MARARQDDLDEELAKEASKDTARSKARGGGTLGGPGDKISVKDKRFSLGDTLLDKETKGRSFSGVLLNFCFANEYYEGKYDKNKPAGAVCWALSEDGEDMEPHKNSADKQNDVCEDCPMNEWGSGTDDGNKRGRKACKQGVRIALVHVDDIETAEAAEEAVIGYIPLPPTSVAPFNKYMDSLQELGRPMYSVITEFSFDDDANYAIVNYEVGEKLKDREIIDALKARRDEALKKIMTPYNKQDAKESDDEDEKPTKRKRVTDDEEDEPTPRKKKRVVEEDDEDEEDKPARKKRSTSSDDDDEDRPARSKRRRAADEDEEDDGDDEDAKPTRKKKRAVEEDDEEEDKPVKKRGSRFGKR